MKMIEFGSDFHFVESYNSGRIHLMDVYRNAILLGDGRQCIVALVRQYGWRRLWIPDYFCYEVIDTIKEQTGVEIVLYEDSPLHECDVERLPYEQYDVLLRMNFFGIRYFRSNKNIPIPVIEDHSHDLFSHWALSSDADWCVVSLRKSLPLPEGGMLWSPNGKKITLEIPISEENEQIAITRWKGMEMKARYLNKEKVNKEEFRKKYAETEEWFDHAEPSLIDTRSRKYITGHLDLNLWLCAKRRNWLRLKELINKEYCEVVCAEHESCNLFSMVILLENREKRDAIRKKLIENCVYSAILWDIPDGTSEKSKDFSKRMLSIHCDGRYSEEDIRELAEILNKALEHQ